ncbi:MAG TPA: ABC transporter substrate-binding protein [Amaricoccus sp.]|uniref:ABC transporter substrate-binding protein n=1 Tax=Amaricoccus sp. TaxID=1872485 RepID=UPI002B63004D|nr:ABC transporter substrate-binding protein [Amaricoccus sp.]HMR53008.1 ABC transporter substrate-binding protein [Amaricoccus sp.]HMR59133.1 ABC transporter substrate-binding protein [Amaricoccus sp.]HMT99938.1 ABC transporter substrate-binding protein [Amaricoccus sp.]
MRSLLRAASCLGGMLVACPALAQELEVVHYWTSEAESKAMGALADAYVAAGGTWVDSATGGGEDATALAISRIMGGDAPSALLTTPGGTVDEMAGSGMLRDFNDLAAAEGWEQQVSPLVWQSMLSDGNVVAIPLGMHADNWIWYSSSLFGELGIEAPKSWDEIIAAADRIDAEGKVGLAIGGEPWQILYVLTDLVIGVGGDELYDALFVQHDAERATGADTIRAFELLREVSGHADEASTGRSWNDTTNMVVTGRAGMQPMGDWAKGEFSAAGLTAGSDYGCMLAPSASGTPYVIVVDVLVFPNPDSDEEAAGQETLASLAMSADVASAIAAGKGSVPVVNTVESGALDHCAALGAAAAREGVVLPTVYSSLSGDQLGQLTDLVGQYWADPSMSAESGAEALAGILSGS